MAAHKPAYWQHPTHQQKQMALEDIWKDKPLWGRMADSTSIIFIVSITFYALQAFFGIFSDISPPTLDFITILSLLIATFLLHLRFGFSRIVPILLWIGFFFHIAGLYNIIPYNQYYTGNLYGAPQLNYHYDWAVHFLAAGLCGTAFAAMAYPYMKRSLKHDAFVFAIILLAVMGLGAVNEITEFAGFSLFGYGEGFMEFGKGDVSPNEGPWNNASMDMVNNLLGGALFIGFYILIRRRRKDSVSRYINKV